MKMILLISILLLVVSSTSVRAFPNGAGGCDGPGRPAVGGNHLDDGSGNGMFRTGTLQDGGIQVSINGQALTPGNTIDILADSSTTNTWSITSGVDFRGFLFRLSDITDTGGGFGTSDSNVQLASTCDQMGNGNVGGMTHTNNDLKTSVSGDFVLSDNIASGTQLNLDVTVVIENRLVDQSAAARRQGEGQIRQSAYFYSGFTLNAMGAPSGSPSGIPSGTPSGTPSDIPSNLPSAGPSEVPSASPSDHPSSVPSGFPSNVPSTIPSDIPSSLPSGLPSLTPSQQSSDAPSGIPSDQPSSFPSRSPTGQPTRRPTHSPTRRPTPRPTHRPTRRPTRNPTRRPTPRPTQNPTHRPTRNPTKMPTPLPTSVVSESPSQCPSVAPTSTPTSSPTPALRCSPEYQVPSQGVKNLLSFIETTLNITDWSPNATDLFPNGTDWLMLPNNNNDNTFEGFSNSSENNNTSDLMLPSSNNSTNNNSTDQNSTAAPEEMISVRVCITDLGELVIDVIDSPSEGNMTKPDMGINVTKPEIGNNNNNNITADPADSSNVAISINVVAEKAGDGGGGEEIQQKTELRGKAALDLFQ